jgi:hypothetical protein
MGWDLPSQRVGPPLKLAALPSPSAGIRMSRPMGLARGRLGDPTGFKGAIRLHALPGPTRPGPSGLVATGPVAAGAPSLTPVSFETTPFAVSTAPSAAGNPAGSMPTKPAEAPVRRPMPGMGDWPKPATHRGTVGGVPPVSASAGAVVGELAVTAMAPR